MARPVYEPATEAEALALVGAAVKKNFPDGLFTGRVKSVDASEKPFCHRFKVEYEDGECEDLEWSELLEVLDQALAPAASKRSAEGANAAGPSKKQKKKAADDEAELRAILDSMDDEENEAPAQQQQQQAPSRKRAAATVTGAHGPSDDKQQPEERQQQQQQQQKKKAQTQTQERTQTQQVQPQQTTQRHGQQQGQGQQQQHAPRAGPSGAAQQGGSSMRTSGGAGHLEMIRLENFMCHELFEMTFGPHVTLVSGTNGSGKSAVMQGLQAALGVSARETGRAQKLAQFIRTGSTEARVQVTIFNTGPDAFEPERLGNRFTIDRRLVASGAGGTWRVLDAQGKHVAKLKPSDVLKHLAINASNPMTIITQDMARAFLSGSGDDKRRKYDMFMEGTLLEVIMEDLGSAQSNLVIAKGRLKEVKDQYTEKIKELNVLQSSLDKLRDVDDLVLIHGDMNVSLVWSYVWKSREEIAVIANQLNVIGPRKIAEITAVIEAKSALLAETCEQEKTLTNQMNASNEAASHINADVAQLRANMKGYTKDRVKLQQTKHQLDAEIDSLRGQKLEYERSLAEDTSERAAEQRAKMAAAEAQVASLRAGVDSAEAALAEQRSRLTDAQSRLAQAKDRLRGVQKTQDGMRYELNNFERQKQDLQASATESVARFGGKAVVQLLKLIHDARPGTFDRPPIGPVGAFLGLKDTRWSVAIEAAIGYSFENFLCHSPRDRATLRQMASHAKCYMPKFTVVQCRFDLDQHKVPDRTRPVYQGRTLTTVMDVITINDRSKEVVILNYLIDSFQIEKSVLMEDPKRAADIMHARCGVNKTFDIYGTGYMVRQQSTARTHAKQCHPRLGMDSEDQLRQLAEAIEQSRGKARAAEQERLQLVSEVQEIERVSREAAMREQEFARTKKQAEHAMRSQAQTLARQQAELTQLMSSTAGDGDSAGDEMATQVAAATAGLFESQAALSDIESRLQAAKRVETEARTLYNEKMQFLASRQDTTSANAEEMEATAVRRVKLEAEVDATRRKLEIVTAKLDSLRAERAAKLEDLREVEKEAGNIGTEEEALVAMERVGEHFEKRVRASFEEKRRKGNPQVLAMSDAEVEENVVEIVKGHTSLDSMEREQIKMAKSIKATEESVGGDRDQLQRDHERLSKATIKLKIKYDSTRDVLHALHKALIERTDGYAKLRETVVDTASQKFMNYLYQRLHTGRIEVNHEKREMSLVVKIKGKIDPNTKAVRDLKQLSGGERSYVTVAFLLAVGEASESPFRCMDEFDVFMDAINRRVATETLLEFAYKHSNFQYVFLTPQDIQAVEDAKCALAVTVKADIPANFLKTVTMRPARPAQ